MYERRTPAPKILWCCGFTVRKKIRALQQNYACPCGKCKEAVYSQEAATEKPVHALDEVLSDTIVPSSPRDVNHGVADK